MYKKLLIFCLLFSLGFSIQAQEGSIRGNVLDKNSGEPIMFGNVYIQGTTLGTTTDLDGFFTITNIPVGTYKLVASYVGYDSTAVEISIRKGSIDYVRLQITEGLSLDVVEVSARKEQKKTTVNISKVTVTPKQIRSLPSTGGEADIAQYLPVLPGIVFTGDQGGQLYIRGGSPIQNKILIDGMTIYNPFHSIGFFSVFETEIIRNVDVLTGGFDATYGGRISAIVDIKTREGNRKRFGGIVSANPFQSKILLEGPLKKLDEEGGGSASFIVTGKHSYINETSKLLYSYATIDTAGIPFKIDPDSLGLPFSFTDLYAKTSFLTSNGSKLNLFGFNFTDRVEYPGFADLNWANFGAGADFKLIPPNSSFIVGGNFNYSNYEIQLKEIDDAPRRSLINSYGATLDFSYFGNNNELKYGLQFNGFNTDFEFRSPLDFTFRQNDFTTELAIFAKYKHKFKNLIIEPSIRLQYYASLSEIYPEPRLGLKYNITDKLRFKFAGGLFSQNLISTVSEQDVVNLFVGFLSGPEKPLFTPGSKTEKTDSKLQKAYHGIAGFEIDITKQIELNVEPYYKGFTQLIFLNRNKLEASDPDYVTETGEAYGIDFSLRYETKQLYLWATYSLGKVNRDDGEQVYPTIFDRRHNVNFLATYNFGGGLLWEASVRWNMGSGFPFTTTQGYYEFLDFEDGIATNPATENGDLGVILDNARNGGRLPYYHRFDASLKKTIEFNKNMKLESTLSVTNAYNRENIFYYNRKTNSRVNQLPILPSLGLVFHF